MACSKCKKPKRLYACGMCSVCYGKTQECFRILFQLKIFGLEFTIRKRYKDRKEYMIWWQKENKEHLNKYKRHRYRNNINGTRDSKLQYEKQRKLNLK